MILAGNYVTKVMVTTEFREISSDEFKNMYLAPLDKAIKKANFGRKNLAQDYGYPLVDARHAVDDIQMYFSHQVEDTTARLYRDILDEWQHFCHTSIILPFSNFKPDNARVLDINSSSSANNLLRIIARQRSVVLANDLSRSTL